MKKIIYLLAVLGSTAFAQTIITTPTVSGTWTTAGSPYLVQVPVTVQDNDVLTIQPGVVVKMYPATKMEIYGQLIASGTSASPIIFEANDTTGWSNDTITAGGWNGIRYRQYAGSGTDNSIFKYCTLKDAKYGYTASYNYNPFTVERSLKVHNSVFTHNTTGLGFFQSSAIIYVQTLHPTDTMDMYKCSIHDNYAGTAVLNITNFPDGYSRVRSSHFYQNHKGGAITVNLGNIIIEDNELDHNDSRYNSCPIMVVGWDALIRRNKIHHNVCENYAGISCQYGRITVENNLICNNFQTNASCGFTEGGGGVHLTCNSSTIDDGFYIVRNNIIANNLSALGGGAICIYFARACISNNHIINNSTPGLYGSGILVNGPGSEIYMRSNLFHSQTSPGNVDMENAVHVYNGSSIWFDYNYIPSAYYRSVQTSLSYMLYGDTTNNVIGTSPGMVAPTTDNNYLTDATSSNFNLLPSSPCINQGDTVGAFPALIDYAGNNRFVGIIDIGAYEYGQTTTTGIETQEEETSLLSIYPNPTEAGTAFTVITPGDEGLLVIYDLSGKQVYNKPVTSMNNTVQLAPGAKGIYLVSFYGKIKATSRIVLR